MLLGVVWSPDSISPFIPHPGSSEGSGLLFSSRGTFKTFQIFINDTVTVDLACALRLTVNINMMSVCGKPPPGCGGNLKLSS